MTATYTEHAQHGRWRKTGQCVYCACGIRIWNGKAPDSDEEQREFAEALDALVALIEAKRAKE